MIHSCNATASTSHRLLRGSWRARITPASQSMRTHREERRIIRAASSVEIQRSSARGVSTTCPEGNRDTPNDGDGVILSGSSSCVER